MVSTASASSSTAPLLAPSRTLSKSRQKKMATANNKLKKKHLQFEESLGGARYDGERESSSTALSCRRSASARAVPRESILEEEFKYTMIYSPRREKNVLYARSGAHPRDWTNRRLTRLYTGRLNVQRCGRLCADENQWGPLNLSDLDDQLARR